VNLEEAGIWIMIALNAQTLKHNTTPIFSSACDENGVVTVKFKILVRRVDQFLSDYKKTLIQSLEN
jgi:hypothetical protein